MSTSTNRDLFAGLVDDAAVFPPGNAPVPVAWAAHLALRAGGYADLLGPLLVGSSGAADLVAAAAAQPPKRDPDDAPGLDVPRVAVGVIARPGVSVEELMAAVGLVRTSPHLRLAGVELAHDVEGTWRRALEAGVPVAVEVTRDPTEQPAALDQIADATSAGRVLAKLRTQATPSAAVPTARELATFLHGAHDRGLPFKLTGGLHHAVASTVPTEDGGTEEQHGALNVLIAVHQLKQGETLDHVVSTLPLRDASTLAALACALDEYAIAQVRSGLASFGCCGVMDPITDLINLGLLPGSTRTPTPDTPKGAPK